MSFGRWVDIIMSMILTFVVTLFPWAVLAALVHHAVYVHHVSNSTNSSDSRKRLCRRAAALPLTAGALASIMK